MNVLTIHGAIAATLQGIEHLTELCDRHGTIVGYFSPVGLGIPKLSSQGRPRRGGPRGKRRPRLSSAEEVFAYLLKATKDEPRRKEIREILARLGNPG